MCDKVLTLPNLNKVNGLSRNETTPEELFLLREKLRALTIGKTFFMSVEYTRKAQ